MVVGCEGVNCVPDNLMSHEGYLYTLSTWAVTIGPVPQMGQGVSWASWEVQCFLASPSD